MAIRVLIMPSAEGDLRDMDVTVARRVASKLRAIESAGRLVGDVKRLTGQRGDSGCG